jgi:hypothetical protein
MDRDCVLSSTSDLVLDQSFALEVRQGIGWMGVPVSD